MSVYSYDNIKAKLDELSVALPVQQQPEVDAALLSLAKSGLKLAQNPMKKKQKNAFKKICVENAHALQVDPTEAEGKPEVENLTDEQATQLRAQAFFAYVHRQILSLDFSANAELLDMFFSISGDRPTIFFNFLTVYKEKLGLADLNFVGEKDCSSAFSGDSLKPAREAFFKNTARAIFHRAVARATPKQLASLHNVGVAAEEQQTLFLDLEQMLLGIIAANTESSLKKLTLNLLNSIGLDEIKNQATFYAAYRVINSTKAKNNNRLAAVLSADNTSAGVIEACKLGLTPKWQAAIGNAEMSTQQIAALKEAAFRKYVEYQFKELVPENLTKDTIDKEALNQQFLAIKALDKYVNGRFLETSDNNDLEQLQRFRFSADNLSEDEHKAIFGKGLHQANLTSMQHQKLQQTCAEKLNAVKKIINTQGRYELDPNLSATLELDAENNLFTDFYTNEADLQRNPTEKGIDPDKADECPAECSLRLLVDFAQDRLWDLAFVLEPDSDDSLEKSKEKVEKAVGILERLKSKLAPLPVTRVGFTPPTAADPNLKKLHDAVDARIDFAKAAQQLFERRNSDQADTAAVQAVREAYKKLFISAAQAPTPEPTVDANAKEDKVEAKITMVFSHNSDDYVKAIKYANTHSFFTAESSQPKTDKDGTMTVSRIIDTELSGTELIHRSNTDGSTSLAARGSTQAHVIKALVLAFKADLINQGKLSDEGTPIDGFTFNLHPSQITIKSGAVNEMGRTDKAGFLQRLNQAFTTQLGGAYQGGLMTSAGQPGLFSAGIRSGGSATPAKSSDNTDDSKLSRP